MSISVILVDDHEIIREGIKSLLNKENDIEVIAQCGNGLEIVELTKKFKPDIIIMDISMPKMNGIEATKIILKSTPDTGIIILSIHKDKWFISEALKAGARGYLLKNGSIQEISTAIREVYNAQIYLNHEIQQFILNDYLQSLSTGKSIASHTLSKREQEILEAISNGRISKEISAELNISVGTVEVHRRNIMDKLNIHTIAELTRYAISKGFISIDPINSWILT